MINSPILRLSVNFRIDVFFDFFVSILAESGYVTSWRGLGVYIHEADMVIWLWVLLM